MDMLTYRGFSFRVEFDAEDGLFFGQIAGINDVISFQGESRPALEAAFRDAVDDYVVLRPLSPTPHGVSGGSETAASS
ncbi:type II toxin-antitoxin system HicB family antitoxin [Methylobacterium sp. J-072]|uniref:type II toxin-antitoxin system HicB family antitoxin n=1 Tax=Methylobacterium sp. J-072 TaxID=2836651 RepID=UPI001FBB1D46|nr:type II toxin-antitoxin system HicB family antitoxin [Methylobacterium sp. J-072]MCJ2093446.1 type II toxin-antitoxin system HicB family antitoxin [Methylobacterium sp. J-072]